MLCQECLLHGCIEHQAISAGVALTTASGSGSNSTALAVSFQNAPYSGSFNNICYNTGAAPYFGIGGCLVSGTTGWCNGNIEFNTGYTGSWDQPYSLEATYA